MSLKRAPQSVYRAGRKRAEYGGRRTSGEGAGKRESARLKEADCFDYRKITRARRKAQQARSRLPYRPPKNVNPIVADGIVFSFSKSVEL